MGKNIIIEQTYTEQDDQQTITLEQYRIKRQRRRKRVARRMARRFPLFAVEFTREEFADYDVEQLEADLQGAKLPKRKRGKSQLQRQGRYPLLRKALSNYYLTKDPKYLREAQTWRKKLFLDFEVVYRLHGKRKAMRFPSTTPVRLIQELGQVQFSSWEELEEILEEKLRYIHVS
jgi:hypothetical protein